MQRRFGSALLAALAAALVVGTAPALAGKVKSQTQLTGAEGEGQATLVIQEKQRGAKLAVKVQGLAPRTEYKVLSDGVHVANFTTNGRGRGKARLGTRDKKQSRRIFHLDYDPTGAQLVVANAAGDPMLSGVLPENGFDEEPSPSVSPSVSPFDGGLDDPCDPSPSSSPSVSPACGGDGDGENDDEPSASTSASVSTAPKGEELDPSPTVSASASPDDVSPTVSDDGEGEVSPSEEASMDPSDIEPSVPDPSPTASEPSEPDDEPSDMPSISPSTSPSPSDGADV
jgi:hypothetical protein